MSRPLSDSGPGPVGEGPTLDPSQATSDWAFKLRGLILWRLVFLSLLLLLTVVLKGQERVFGFPASFFPFYLLVALQFFISLIYLLLLRRRKAGRGAAAVQLVTDGLFVTVLVYLTGGTDSFFSFLYFLVILAGGVLFRRRGGMWTAAYAFVSYVLILLLPRSGWIPFITELAERTATVSYRYLLYLLVMNGLGFFFVGYLGSLLSELTRRQQDQIEVQKRNIARLEEWNRLMVENLDMGLLTLDRNGCILSVNPAGEKILKRPVEDLIGRPLSGFFSLDQGNEKGRGEEGLERMETRYIAGDGSSLIIGFTLYRVRGEAAERSALGSIVSFKDISKIKAMEERLRQEDRLAIIGRMAAGIAHEIRNPLASISGSLQLFKEWVGPEGTEQRLLEIISRELNKLDGLIRDFLTFSRPVQMPSQPIPLSEQIGETVELFQKNPEVTSAVRFRVEVEPDLELKIPAKELSQVLWNLLTNALQALPGEGEIVVRAEKIRKEEGDRVVIRVEDNGCGIAEEERGRIFEPFYTTKEKGVGLGLAIVQKIVTDCGGSIEVDSQPGRGTTFSLHFPLS